MAATSFPADGGAFPSATYTATAYTPPAFVIPVTVDEARAVLDAASVGLTPGLVQANVPTQTGEQLEAAIRVIVCDEIAKQPQSSDHTKKHEFLATAIREKQLANAACGFGDPYPHDVRSQEAVRAFYALGGTEAELNAAWQNRGDV